LPTIASVSSYFSGSKAVSNGVEINPLEGSVWAFDYKGESYSARFDTEGKFYGYVSQIDASHTLTYNGSTLPQIDPNFAKDQSYDMAAVAAVGILRNGNTGNPWLKGAVVATGITLTGVHLYDAWTSGKTIDLPISITRPVAIPITDTKPNNDDKYLYRFDTRNPYEIALSGGFKSHGTNLDLFEHAYGTSIDNKTSAYISTSKSESALKESIYPGTSGWIYKIASKPLGRDVNKILGWKSPHPLEQEVAVPFYISLFSIKSFYPFSKL